MQVIYEDNHIVAINKTFSEIVQGDKTRDTSLDRLVKQYLKEKYNKPGDVFLGVTHRIDRPVSGIVLFARTSKSLTRLNEMFMKNEIKKIYWAIVKNRPSTKDATLIHHLVRNQKQNKSYCFDAPKADSKMAELSYSVISQSDRYSLLEIQLKTGRHHQIRAQLASINCPIKGDLKYGYNRSNTYPGISLHARKISFIHPVKKELIELIAEPPSEEKLWQVFINQING